MQPENSPESLAVIVPLWSTGEYLFDRTTLIFRLIEKNNLVIS